VRSLNDRLVAVAKAIQADGASKDSIIAVEPRLWITSELPSPIRDFTQIPAGSVVADTFFFSKTIFIIGVGAGSNADGPTLEPGLWRLRGWIRTDMINAASNNLFTQLILQAPIGAALLAVHFNTGALNKSQITQIDQTLSIITPGIFPRMSSSQTFAGETLNVTCAISFSRLL